MIRNCKNCAGRVHFDIKSQKLVCNSCSSNFEVGELGDALNNTGEMECDIYACSSCGAELIVNDTRNHSEKIMPAIEDVLKITYVVLAIFLTLYSVGLLSNLSKTKPIISSKSIYFSLFIFFSSFIKLFNMIHISIRKSHNNRTIVFIFKI